MNKSLRNKDAFGVQFPVLGWGSASSEHIGDSIVLCLHMGLPLVTAWSNSACLGKTPDLGCEKKKGKQEPCLDPQAAMEVDDVGRGWVKSEWRWMESEGRWMESAAGFPLSTLFELLICSNEGVLLKSLISLSP